MKIDLSKSKYRERDSAKEEFDLAEVKHLRTVLRRLRYLEQKIREAGGLDGAPESSLIFDGLEVEGLEFALTELGFLETTKEEETAV